MTGQGRDSERPMCWPSNTSLRCELPRGHQGEHSTPPAPSPVEGETERPNPLADVLRADRMVSEMGWPMPTDENPQPLHPTLAAPSAVGETRVETVHACPPGDEGYTPCCQQSPWELPRTDRMTSDPALVTCGAEVRVEWEVTGEPGHGYPSYRSVFGNPNEGNREGTAEERARKFIELVTSVHHLPWDDGPHLRTRTVTTSPWLPVTDNQEAGR